MSTLDIAMSATEAKQITVRIKLLVNSITETTDKVVSVIEQAETGKAWQALGYASWTAYVAAEFHSAVAGLARAERVPITAKLAETGMSVRAISSVTGTSVGTVHNDIVDSGVQSLNTSTTGTDGKRYVRNGRPTSTGVHDIGNAVPEVRKSRRRSLPDQYWHAVYDLQKSVERLERLTGDDRFAANAAALYDRNGRTLERLAQVLHDNVNMPLVRGGGQQ